MRKNDTFFVLFNAVALNDEEQGLHRFTGNLRFIPLDGDFPLLPELIWRLYIPLRRKLKLI